jgi:hypothetical protein
VTTLLATGLECFEHCFWQSVFGKLFFEKASLSRDCGLCGVLIGVAKRADEPF